MTRNNDADHVVHAGLRLGRAGLPLHALRHLGGLLPLLLRRLVAVLRGHRRVRRVPLSRLPMTKSNVMPDPEFETLPAVEHPLQRGFVRLQNMHRD